jgi:hypothetical protein
LRRAQANIANLSIEQTGIRMVPLGGLAVTPIRGIVA